MNRIIAAAAFVAGMGVVHAAEPVAKPEANAKPQAAPKVEAASKREVRLVEGWTVEVDVRLLAAPNEDLGKLALRILGDKLFEITRTVPAGPLAKLQKVRIVMDLGNPTLKSMQYHPGAQWLIDHGHDAGLAKAFHIPVVQNFINPRELARQPWAVLHELAHGYHDQVLGFDHAKIKEAYKKAVESKIYDSVMRYDGKMVKHYALTTPMEYFAESTEAYFGTNDFYPFVKAELRKHDPEMYAILEDVWGKRP